MKFVSKEAQNSSIIAAIWTVLSSQAAFSWRHSVREILSKWFPTSLLSTTLGYGHSRAIFVWAKHAPNSDNDSSEDNEVDNCLGKIHFALLLANFKSDRMMSHEHGLAAKDSFKMAASEVASFKMNFFRKAGISEAETLVSGKAKCSLAIGEDKKVSFLGQLSNW